MTPGILVSAPTTGIVDHRIGTPSLLVRPKRSISLSYRAVKNLEIYNNADELCSSEGCSVFYLKHFHPFRSTCGLTQKNALYSLSALCAVNPEPGGYMYKFMLPCS
jgi:hypothetical protein